MTRQQLTDHIFSKMSFLCVGLDTDISKLPPHLLDHGNPVIEFNKAVIDRTAHHCVAYKINTAFYEAMGIEGWRNMEETIKYIRSNYPRHFIIADAKRGDIGNTSKMYAKTFFNVLDSDAVTVNPYMGHDSVKPFLECQGKWTILLALTSNQGAEDFQLLNCSDTKATVYDEVLTKSKNWGNSDNLMYVVGATKASMLKEIREIVPDHFLLVPGVGAQGGSLRDVVAYGANDNCGLLVNASRSIIYASSDKDFAEASEKEAAAIATEMSELINRYVLKK